MKKSLFILLLSFLFLAGCTNSDDQETENQENETAETENEENNSPETDEAADNAEEDTQATAEEEETNASTGLTLQLTKIDEENGSSLENGIYSEINQLMEENPNMGTENDFSVFTVDVYNTDAGRSLVLLGINRTSVELTNVSFDLNLGSNEAFVLEDQPVNLSEEEMGVFPVNGVMPFIIDISDEQADALLNINAAEVLLTLDNFEYEEAE